LDADLTFGKPKGFVEPVAAATPILTPSVTTPAPEKPVEVTAKSIISTPTHSGNNGRGSKLSKTLLDEIAGRKTIPLKNNFYTILAQCPDSSYATLVSTNPKKDLETINKGGRLRYRRLPVEFVYLRAHNNRKDADIVRDIISKYKLPQKEKLVAAYERQIFSN